MTSTVLSTEVLNTIANGDTVTDIGGIDEEITTHFAAIASLRNHRNNLMPVSRLPPEVLAIIFTWLAHRSEHLVPRADWIWVTHVCKQWRFIALNCPRLWSHICSFTHKPMVLSFLTRSKAAPLTIRFNRNPNFRRGSVLNFRIALDHISRIRDLEITGAMNLGGDDWQSVKAALAVRAPKLERFCIRAMFGAAVTTVFTLPELPFNGDTPLLKSLTINSFDLPWTSTLLQGLTELNLSGLFKIDEPSLQNILSVLEKCPNLEELVLDRVGPTDKSSTSDEATLKIALPQLRKFRLAFIGTSMCRKLLDCVKMANEVEWDIHCHSYSLDNPVDVLPHLISPDMECEKLHITLGLSSLIVEATTKSGHRNIRIPTRLSLDITNSQTFHSTAMKAFNAIGMLIEACFWRDTEIVKIQFIASGMIVHKDSWTKLFKSLPQLQFFTCDIPRCFFSVDTESGLLDALMYSDPSITGSCISPHLYGLELSNPNLSQSRGNIFERLLIFLQFRWEHARPIMHLKISRANGLVGSMVEKVGGLVDEVVWDGVEDEDESDEDEDEDDEIEFQAGEGFEDGEDGEEYVPGQAFGHGQLNLGWRGYDEIFDVDEYEPEIPDHYYDGDSFW